MRGVGKLALSSKMVSDCRCLLLFNFVVVFSSTNFRWKRKYVLEKMTATLKSKQTSITLVRYQLLPVFSLLTPLIFHYPLPSPCPLPLNTLNFRRLKKYLQASETLNSALSRISKRKHKRFDIEAYNWNKTKTFWFGPLIIGTKSERFNLFQNT